MELKRATELVICDLLKEQLTDLVFYPAKGGGNDVTPVWLPSHYYHNGEIIRPTNLALTHAVVIIATGTSGVTEPGFSDTVGELFTGPPDYQTILPLSIPKAIDAGTPTPPFAIVEIIDGEKTMHQQETSFLNGAIHWITRADATNVVTHSLNFKRIYDVFSEIVPGYDFLRRIIVHGIDLAGTTDYIDEARQAHGDVIHFTMGVTEKPIV